MRHRKVVILPSGDELLMSKIELLDKINLIPRPQIDTTHRIMYSLFHDAEREVTVLS